MCKYDGMTEGQVLSLQGNADLVHEVRDRMATYVDGDPMLSVQDLLTGEPADLRRDNYGESVGWYESITTDIFG